MRHIAIIMVAALAVAPLPVRAATKSWNGGFDNWNDPSNWSPVGVPLSADDVLIGNLFSQENDFVNLDVNDIIGSLAITDGMTLDTNGFTLLVNGDVTISGRNLVGDVSYPSRVRVDRGAGSDDFDANNITVSNNADIDFTNGGIMEVDNVLTVAAGSGLHGAGVVNFIGSDSRVLVLDGVLDPSTDGMTINQQGTGLLDLDGDLGNGIIAASAGKIDGTAFDHITINGTQLADTFNGEINLTAGGFVAMNMTNGWTAGTGSTINFYASSAAGGQPAVISGGHVTFDDAVITVTGSGSTGYGQVTADATFEPGTSVNVGLNDLFETTGTTTVNGGTFTLDQGGRIDFEGSTTVGGGTFNTFSTSEADGDVNFNGPSTWKGNVTFNGVAQVNNTATVVLTTTIDADVFDLDGSTGTATWNINSALTINADATETAGSAFNGTLNFLGGAIVPVLSINLTNPADFWVMDGALNLAGNDIFVVNRIAGNEVRISGTTNVTSGTNVGILADAVFTSTSVTNMGAIDTYLRMSGDTTVLAGATFNGFGKFANTGNMRLANGADTGSVAVENRGTLTVGNSPGHASTGPLTNAPTGTIAVEIGGKALGTQYDNLDVSGVAFLGGTLQVDLINNFVPSPGDTFEVLSYSFNNGQFDALTGDVVFGPGYLDFLHPLYLPDALLLYAPVTGDANLDGSVDGLDYLIWAEFFGDNPAADPPGSPMNGDLNGDGLVDGLDYLLWASQYGSGPLDSVAIPEPATGLLLAIGAILWWSRRREISTEH
ncbi:MAG: dockerin type I domain-containing protein [Pirellulales bacterium]